MSASFSSAARSGSIPPMFTPSVSSPSNGFGLTCGPQEHHENASVSQTAAHSEIGASQLRHGGRQREHHGKESRQVQAGVGLQPFRRSLANVSAGKITLLAISEMRASIES